MGRSIKVGTSLVGVQYLTDVDEVEVVAGAREASGCGLVQGSGYL